MTVAKILASNANESSQPLLELLRLLLGAEIKTCRATTQYKRLKTYIFKVLGKQLAFHVHNSLFKALP